MVEIEKKKNQALASYLIEVAKYIILGTRQYTSKSEIMKAEQAMESIKDSLLGTENNLKKQVSLIKSFLPKDYKLPNIVSVRHNKTTNQKLFEKLSKGQWQKP